MVGINRSNHIRSMKAAVVVLTAAVFVSSAASCYRTEAEETVIRESDPWYDITSVKINPGIDSTDFEYVNNDYVTRIGDSYLYHLNGILNLPEDFDLQTHNYMDYSVDRLDFYDISGERISSLDMADFFRGISPDEYTVIKSMNRTDDGLKIDFASYDLIEGSHRLYRCLIDPDDYSISDPYEISEFGFVERMRSEDATNEGTVKIGDYSIIRYWINDGVFASYVLEIIDGDDNVTELDLREEFPTANIHDISAMVDMGDGNILVCAGFFNRRLFYKINLQMMVISDVTSEMDWFTYDTDRIRMVEGLGSVITDNLGVYKIDFVNHMLIPVFMYSDSNVNLYELRDFDPISVTDEKSVFTGTVTPVNAEYGTDSETMIYIFNKADTNPNAGKTILSLAVIDDYSYSLCRAVCEFNETNEEYFLVYDESYRLDDDPNGDFTSVDEYELAIDQAASELGDRLTIDLMSGEGPDIIINGATFGMLNDADYLIDLRGYIQDNLTQDSYFTSVTDAAMTDGALYQLPLSFAVAGIAVNESDAEEGQQGFTFEQYRDFVEGPCNGTNPIPGGKLFLFTTALNCMQDLVINGDQVNYDCDAFRSLAMYVDEYVNDELELEDLDTISYPDNAALMFISGITDYYAGIVSANRVLLGVPSYDGRGPIIYGSDSVAVSANAGSVEGCLEFVSILMSDEIQVYYGMENGLPLNRNAFMEAGQALIDYQNDYLNDLLRYYSEEQLRVLGYDTDPMDESTVEQFADQIDGLTGWYTNDGSINAIIREEMDAFFSGQKTLDQVIPVIEERVQNLLNERMG